MGESPTGRKIPLIVLGGSDRKPVRLPPTGRDQHPLSGCKGVDIRIGGRCLIDHLVERLMDSEAFDPIVVAGPATAYKQAETDLDIIDTDRAFGENIQAGLEGLLGRRPTREMAWTTCDILPKVTELRELMDDYRVGSPSDLWFPVIRAEDPEQLGVSGWKPKYRIRPAPGEVPVTVLPGHLMVVDPASLRLRFLYRLFDLGYRTRNRPIRFRRSYILRQVLFGLLEQDFVNLLGLQLPTLTWEVVRSGVKAAAKLSRGEITREELEGAVHRMFVSRRHRRLHPERRVRIPFMDALSIARDIDTEEEALAVGASPA